MVYVIGDSHATFTFKDIEGIRLLARRGVTLKRMTYVEEEMLPNIMKRLRLTAKDFLIFCYGEVDIRCHIHPIITHRKKTTLDELLKDWSHRYASRLSLLDVKEAKVVIMSVVPPSSKERIRISEETKQKEIIVLPPAHGRDAERALYTKTINKYLKEECEQRGWIYFDVYSRYVDEKGMMIRGKGDGTVHIGDTTEVKKLLQEMKIL